MLEQHLQDVRKRVQVTRPPPGSLAQAVECGPACTFSISSKLSFSSPEGNLFFTSVFVLFV